MDQYRRYALYVMTCGRLHEEASRWLGWDARAGIAQEHLRLPGLPQTEEVLTSTARNYGFHGTIKPPFRLAEGMTQTSLEEACRTILPGLATARIERLVVRPLGGFVAMVPETPSASLNRLAAQVVERFDRWRAPPDDAELARRRKHGLSARQEELLQLWGYPYVMDEFRFHMTLSTSLPDVEAQIVASRLAEHFDPFIPEPFDIEGLSLIGEDDHGHCHVIADYLLGSLQG